MNFIHLFAGIGGDALGLERSGMTCVGSVDIDQHCRNVLAKHWPAVPQHDDVTTLHADTFQKPVDLITGGFPCQDASVARAMWGERSGLDGDRTGLFWETLRVIEEIRPRVVLLENVKGLLSAQCGCSFGQAVQALDDIGYVGQWRVVDGAAFGLPLRRSHLLLLGFDSRHPGGVPERPWLEDAESGDSVGSQLREGVGQPRSTDGRPVRGQDYRLLTPEECEIGLGFPVGWTAGQSDTRRYMQLGNAAAVPVFHWAGSRIRKALKV